MLGLGVIDNSQIITYIISNIIDNLWSVISWNRGESVALMKEAKLPEISLALRGLLWSLKICLDVRREGLRDEWANGRLIEIAKMVKRDCSNGYDPDTILAEYWMDNAIRPLTLQEAMLTDRRAERASIRLSRLVESGHIDPVVAEGFIDYGLNPRILKNIKDELIGQGAIDVEAYKNPERHYSYLV